MPLLPLLLLFFAAGGLFAQPVVTYQDVVDVRGGGRHVGTLVGYVYGEEVRLVEPDGELIDLPWARVRRVYFRQASVSGLPPVAAPPTRVTERRWRHQLSGSVGFGRTENRFNSFASNSTTVGIGIAYHFVYPVGNFRFGVGPEFELKSHSRRERLLSGSAFAEVLLGQRRVRPFLRLTAGGSLPVGGGDQLELEERTLGGLLHPAIGLYLGPPDREVGGLLFDLGYRFTTVSFVATNSTFDRIERRIDYRRLILRMAMRF